MQEKFKDRYRIESNRKPNWDYSNDGVYFITLVTQHRESNLGEITDGKMVLSDFGHILKREWEKSFEIRTELYNDEYIIMPNHIHAIIILNTNETPNDNHHRRDARPCVSTNTNPCVSTNTNPCVSTNTNPCVSTMTNPCVSTGVPITTPSNLYRQPKSISSFVAGFKSIINTQIDNYIDENNLNIPKYNKNNHFFQPNYYDHIIRNETEFWRIKQYIINNPMQWNTDTLNE